MKLSSVSSRSSKVSDLSLSATDSYHIGDSCPLQGKSVIHKCIEWNRRALITLRAVPDGAIAIVMMRQCQGRFGIGKIGARTFDLRNMFRGIAFRQFCIGMPKIRNAMPRCHKCAAIDRPHGPAPIMAISGLAEPDRAKSVFQNASNGKRRPMEIGRFAAFPSLRERNSSRASRLDDGGQRCV